MESSAIFFPLYGTLTHADFEYCFLKLMTGIFQKILPKHSLSRLIGRFCKSEIVFLKNFLISTFCLFYKVDFSKAKKKKKNIKHLMTFLPES